LIALTGDQLVRATTNMQKGQVVLATGALGIVIATDSSPICMTLTMQVSVANEHITLAHSLKRVDADTAKACDYSGAEKTTDDLFVLKGSPRWEKKHQWFPAKTDEPKQHP
jgi:hypothetical protein